MPCKSSTCYGITFRPTLTEFDQYKTQFMENVKNKYYKYVFSLEKGSGDNYNHYQGYIELGTEKRADNFRKEFTEITKEMKLSHPKVALRIKPIHTDPDACIGYVLKEQDEINENVYFAGFDISLLQKCQEYYKNLKMSDKILLDKERVQIRNLPVIFKNFFTANEDRIIEMVGNGKYNLKDDDIKSIIMLMAQEDYCLLPIIMSKEFNKIIKFLRYYIQEKLVEMRNHF